MGYYIQTGTQTKNKTKYILDIALELFSNPSDPRPKTWLLMDRARAEELTGHINNLKRTQSP